MHVFTHLSEKYENMRTAENGRSVEEAGMAQLDDIVDSVMKYLNDNGLENNTILAFSIWAGQFADRKGAKSGVVAGLFAAAASGLLYVLSLALTSPAASVSVLLLGRAVLGGAPCAVIMSAWPRVGGIWRAVYQFVVSLERPSCSMPRRLRRHDNRSRRRRNSAKFRSEHGQPCRFEMRAGLA